MPKIAIIQWEQPLVSEGNYWQIQACNVEARCSRPFNSQHVCSYSNCPLTRINFRKKFQKTLF